MITIPTDFTSNISANASTIFSDLSPVAILLGGTFFALMIISWLISSFRGNKNESYTYKEIDDFDY